jgi:hypothetical protein
MFLMNAVPSGSRVEGSEKTARCGRHVDPSTLEDEGSMFLQNTRKH